MSGISTTPDQKQTMAPLDEELSQLIHRAAHQPWPTNQLELTRWARQIGFPTEGEPIDDPGDGTLGFTAESHGGRAFWYSSADGHVVHVSLIIGAVDPEGFDTLRATAEQLRARLDATYKQVDADVQGPSWREEWQAGTVDVELYWSDPRRQEPPLDAALHLALDPRAPGVVVERTPWQVTVRDNTTHVEYQQTIESELPLTTLRIVNFTDEHGAPVARAAVVVHESDVGVPSEDDATPRTLAATMAGNMVTDGSAPGTVRDLITGATRAQRWNQDVTILIDGQEQPAHVLRHGEELWALYARRGDALFVAGLRVDPRRCTLAFAKPERSARADSAHLVHAVAVDERDSSWENHQPTFRVCLHDSSSDSTAGATATYDLTGADVLQAIDWA